MSKCSDTAQAKAAVCTIIIGHLELLFFFFFVVVVVVVVVVVALALLFSRSFFFFFFFFKDIEHRASVKE